VVCRTQEEANTSLSTVLQWPLFCHGVKMRVGMNGFIPRLCLSVSAYSPPTHFNLLEACVCFGGGRVEAGEWEAGA
jgi:hypothetical protein